MAVQKVHKVEAEPLERSFGTLEKVLTVEGVLHVGDIVGTPEELGRHNVAVAGPAESGDRFAHDLLRLAGGINLGVVEEIDPPVVCGTQALDGRVVPHLGAEGHP